MSVAFCNNANLGKFLIIKRNELKFRQGGQKVG